MRSPRFLSSIVFIYLSIVPIAYFESKSCIVQGNKKILLSEFFSRLCLTCRIYSYFLEFTNLIIDRTELVGHISNLAVDTVGTGIMGKLGNKGGVGVRLRLVRPLA